MDKVDILFEKYTEELLKKVSEEADEEEETILEEEEVENAKRETAKSRKKKKKKGPANTDEIGHQGKFEKDGSQKLDPSSASKKKTKGKKKKKKKNDKDDDVKTEAEENMAFENFEFDESRVTEFLNIPILAIKELIGPK